MLGNDTWVDLLDPTAEELGTAVDIALHDLATAQILAPAEPDNEPRPTIRNERDYLFGVLLSPARAPNSREIIFQEIDVIITPSRLITIRKTPSAGPAFFCEDIQEAAHRNSDGVGMALWHLVDSIAERFLNTIDALDEEIDALEDRIETDRAAHIRQDISRLRRSLLRVRRALTPLRDATQAIVTDHLELSAEPLFPRDVEVHFFEAHDKLLRATDGLDLARDLLAGVRDYHQSEIANNQAETAKTLTVIASLLLLPTFIVGLYGQNLQGSPEQGWSGGYSFSWFLIIATTIGQLVYFRRKGWIGSRR